MIKTVSVHELSEQLDTDPETVLIDLRDAREFAQGHIARAHNLPLGSMQVREIMAEWGREADGKPIYFICQSGGRSQQLLDQLEDAGFYWAQSVAGGMVAWQALELPQETGVPAWGGESWRGRVAQVVGGLLVLAGCVLGLLVHAGFFYIPMLVAAEMLFCGLTGWPGLASILRKKGGAR